MKKKRESQKSIGKQAVRRQSRQANKEACLSFVKKSKKLSTEVDSRAGRLTVKTGK